MNDQSPSLNLSPSEATFRGPISRRTILAGSAIAVPAIVLSAGTPAFAGSGLALAFDKASYSGQGCSTISGAMATAKEGATPKAGVAVTVSLADGYTFATGGTTFTKSTDSAGSLALPDINIPAAGGSSTISATAAGASAATAAISGTAGIGAFYIQNGARTVATGVPAGSKPMSNGLFLASDGRVIDGANNGKVLATNVDVFGDIYVDNNNWTLPLRKKDGTCTIIINGGTDGAATGVPSGSTPVEGTLFCASDGRLINGQGSGAVLATNVASWGSFYWDSERSYLPLKKSDGSFSYLQNYVEQTAIGVPSGSAAAAAHFFLSPDGRLIMGGGGGGVLASNIESIGRITLKDNKQWLLALKKRDGSCTFLEGRTENTAVNVPSGSTPATGPTFIAPDGRLIYAVNGQVFASGVTGVGGNFYLFGSSYSRFPINAPATECNSSTPAPNDLLITSMAVTTDNVSQNQGRPVYGPEQTPFVDVEILNQGSGSVPYVDLQLGWASDLFSNIVTPLPSGWVQTADVNSNVRTLTFRREGTLNPGQRITGRFFWKLPNAQTMRQGGPWLDSVRGNVIPVGTDSNTGNNTNSVTYYATNGTSGGSTPPVNQNFDIQFVEVDLPANAGGNNYNGVPLFRPNWEAYIEFKIYNGGPGTVTQPMAVVDFDASDTGVQRAYVSPSTPQWTQIQDWVANGRHYYRLRWSGTLTAGQRTDLCRVPFTIASKVPGGTAPNSVGLLAEPTQGDTNLDNQRSGGGYRTIA